jgi:glycosyltransferase involved in cell wall biosynthesis
MIRMQASADSRDLRRAVEKLEQEVERQQETIDTLDLRVAQLQDFAGLVNLERRRKGRIGKRLERLAAPALTVVEQHRPRALRVPRRYLRACPPDPAPRISVVTPSFNQGRFIDRTIRSVIDQGYPELEYVVQDGGSTDETTDVLERYADRLARVVSAPDGGQADAINRGFADTTGEIMAYLNSDDLLLPGSLAYVASYFSQHPEVDAVYGHRVVVDRFDRDIGMWVVPRHRDWVLTISDVVPQETLFWRRRVWERAGGRVDSELDFAIDYDLLLRFVATEARIVRLPRFLGAFRTHPVQKTVAKTDIGIGEAEVLRERWHGYAMPEAEVASRLRPFYRRHVALHLVYRIRDFMPIRRVDVLSATPVSVWPQTALATTPDQ